MTIKFLDRAGTHSVASAPDNARFSLRNSGSSGYMVIAEYQQERKNSSGKAVTLNETEVFSGTLDKSTAEKCIDKIYEQLEAKESFCDLTDIQGEE